MSDVELNAWRRKTLTALIDSYDNFDEAAANILAALVVGYEGVGQVEARVVYGLWNVPNTAMENIPQQMHWIFESPFRTAESQRSIIQMYFDNASRRRLDSLRGSASKYIEGVVVRYRSGVYGPWKDAGTPKRDDSGREWLEE